MSTAAGDGLHASQAPTTGPQTVSASNANVAAGRKVSWHGRSPKQGRPYGSRRSGRSRAGEPRRKISYGEAIALSRVFGIEDVGELGQPAPETANLFLSEAWESLRELQDSAGRLAAVLGNFRKLAERDPDWGSDPHLLRNVRDLMVAVVNETAELRARLDAESGQ